MQHVHLIHGESAAATLRRVLARSADDVVFTLRDSLCCGPLPRASSLADWAAARQDFWQHIGALDDGVSPPDALPDLALLREAASITLWLGTCLDEQLLLPWLTWLLPLAGVERESVRVVQFPEASRDGDRRASLGMFSALELRRHPAPIFLDGAALTTLDRAWQALTDDTPAALRAFIAQDESAGPLRAALRRLAYWYPQVGTGLARWDHALLSNAGREGPRASHVVAHTLATGDRELEHIGDGWLYWRLRRLAAMRHPLLVLDGDEAQWGGLIATVTRAGHEVLSGAANAIQLNGIDDWVAGVHLDSTAGRVWYAKGDEILC